MIMRPSNKPKQTKTNHTGYLRKDKNMREVATTLAATAALLIMSVILAGCAHIVPEKQTHVAAKAAVHQFVEGNDISMIVEGQNSQSEILV